MDNCSGGLLDTCERTLSTSTPLMTTAGGGEGVRWKLKEIGITVIHESLHIKLIFCFIIVIDLTNHCSVISKFIKWIVFVMRFAISCVQGEDKIATTVPR